MGLIEGILLVDVWWIRRQSISLFCLSWRKYEKTFGLCNLSLKYIPPRPGIGVRRACRRFGFNWCCGVSNVSAANKSFLPHTPPVLPIKKGKKKAFSEDKLSLGRDVFMKHPRLMNKNVGDNLFLPFWILMNPDESHKSIWCKNNLEESNGKSFSSERRMKYVNRCESV